MICTPSTGCIVREEKNDWLKRLAEALRKRYTVIRAAMMARSDAVIRAACALRLAHRHSTLVSGERSVAASKAEDDVPFAACRACAGLNAILIIKFRRGLLSVHVETKNAKELSV
jgi:hypothetical protein